MTTRIIGIDFGTSTTVIRVHDVGQGNPIRPLLINGSSVVPTIAFKPEGSDEVLYGWDANAKIQQSAKGEILQNFKMKLAEGDEERQEAAKLIEGFMKYINEQYIKLLNAHAFSAVDNVKVYISHPAKWDSSAINLMKNSVVKAGFCSADNVLAKDEPTAAVLASLHERSEELKNAGMLYDGESHRAMMIDMGAGTTDIVLFCYTVKDGKTEISDIFTYPSMTKSGFCGGREIDEALIKAAEQFVKRMTNGAASGRSQRQLNKLKRKIKVWKENVVSEILKKGTESVIAEPEEIAELRDDLIDMGFVVANEGEKFIVTRDFFEHETCEHWVQWEEIMVGAFAEARQSQFNDLNCPKRPEDVEILIITGGHSLWYIVHDYFKSSNEKLKFQHIIDNPNLLIQSEFPQETVAVGLCYLDEDMVKCHPVPNDVDISFTCEDKFLGATNLVKKGMLLPYERKDIELKNKIKGNFIYGRALTIKYVITTDGNHQITREAYVEDEGLLKVLFNTVLAAIGVAVWDIPKISWKLITFQWDEIDPDVLKGVVNYDYDLVLKPVIQINEEGIIKLGGNISVGTRSINIPEITI